MLFYVINDEGSELVCPDCVPTALCQRGSKVLAETVALTNEVCAYCARPGHDGVWLTDCADFGCNDA
jgi:hypothetical protein